MANEKISQLPIEAGTPDLNTLIEISAWSGGPVYVSKSYTLSQLKALVYNGLANDLSGGLGGQILYQSAVNNTESLVNGTAGQLLQSNGAANAPSWVNAPAAGITGSATVDYVPMMDTTTAIETSPISVKVGAVGINTIEDNAGLIVKEKSSASGLPILAARAFNGDNVLEVTKTSISMFLEDNGFLFLGGGLAFVSVAIATLVANTNNLTIPDTSILYIETGGSAYNLTGIVPPVGEGHILYLYKNGAGTVTLVNNATSVGTNRFDFHTAANVLLLNKQALRVIYIAGRWRIG